jgi:hypothetical protein
MPVFSQATNAADTSKDITFNIVSIKLNVFPTLAEYKIDSSSAFTFRNTLGTTTQKKGFDIFYNNFLNYNSALEQYYLGQTSLLNDENSSLKEKLNNDSVEYAKLEESYKKAESDVVSLSTTNDELNKSLDELKHKRAMDIIKIGGIGVGIGIVVAVPITIYLMSKASK